MSPSKRFLDQAASETGFRKETLEKVVRLGELLSDVTRHPFLSKVLALKGGTALNLCFGEPKRLSVDLDFNYIGSEKRSQMLTDRPEIERAIRQIADSHEYQCQSSSDEHAGRKFFLKYTSAYGTPDRVEIDLNFLHRVPLLPVQKHSLWQPREIEPPRPLVVSLEELCTGKLCALLDRCQPRDLFDVAQFPVIARNVLETPTFRALFVAMAGTLDHALYKYGSERLKRVTDETVQSELHPMLTADQRPSASNLQTNAWKVIEPLLDLTPEERKYSEMIQSGDLEVELLIQDDPELVERLGHHPALLWKAENARRYSKRRQSNSKPEED